MGILNGFGADILSELAAAVIGGVVVFFSQWLRRRYRESQGLFSGTWTQYIFHADQPDQLHKTDEVHCKHVGEVVEADIRRLLPEKERKRAWHFNGRYRDGQLYGHFWAREDQADSKTSRGTIFLRYSENHQEDCFSGYYERLEKVSKGKWGPVEVTIERIPLEWKRPKRTL